VADVGKCSRITLLGVGRGLRRGVSSEVGQGLQLGGDYSVGRLRRGTALAKGEGSVEAPAMVGD